ncbi:MAG: Nramp family divalent metal transporter [Patescibacteria group bacterium]
MDLPKAPKFRKLLGPSFILLGLGLGSGEIILWPYLSANYGLGIIWGAVLGISLQFFINMEIERFALVKGESIFVGFWRKFKLLPFWFIFSTFLGFGWPGIIASSAKIFSSIFGFENSSLLAIGLLILVGLILTLGPVLYKTVENFQKILIFFGVPSVFVLAILLARNSDWTALVNGIIGRGDGYVFLPVGIPLVTFLGALAFSGAGGNLNLAQSFYIKEKGYGMGKFSGKITSILTGKVEDISLYGEHFRITTENIKSFKQWWKLINLEHLIIFWFTGLITMLLLALLSYSTSYGQISPSGINFIFHEASQIASATFAFVGTFFLLLCGLMLFATQFTVMDATSRIMSENLLLIKENWKSQRLPKIYYSFLWLQIVFGIGVFLLGVTEPFVLLATQAAINAFAMFIHIGLTLWLNMTELKHQVRPSVFRIAMMLFAFVFFGFFSVKTLLQWF